MKKRQIPQKSSQRTVLEMFNQGFTFITTRAFFPLWKTKEKPWYVQRRLKIANKFKK